MLRLTHITIQFIWFVPALWLSAFGIECVCVREVQVRIMFLLCSDFSSFLLKYCNIFCGLVFRIVHFSRLMFTATTTSPLFSYRFSAQIYGISVRTNRVCALNAIWMELKDRVYTYPSPDEKQNIIRNKERNNTCKTKCSYSLARPRKSQYDPHHTHNQGKRSRLFSYFISQMPQKSPLNTIKYGLWLMFCNALICFDERTIEQKRRIFMEKQQNCLLI